MSAVSAGSGAGLLMPNALAIRFFIDEPLLASFAGGFLLLPATATPFDGFVVRNTLGRAALPVLPGLPSALGGRTSASSSLNSIVPLPSLSASAKSVSTAFWSGPFSHGRADEPLNIDKRLRPALNSFLSRRPDLSVSHERKMSRIRLLPV